ncbi:MAG: glycosyltransferase family 2 protein [Candidatus Poseidoniaceae archaeon]|jgi:glycosyltransferase involved in cell wall biosynthesis|nr:glycosyltransferase family 2 protein [Candidatus Poseidoniaceae archaeon]
MLGVWRIGVVIPARNEEAAIAEVLETLPVHVDLAVVVDDGSTDRTAERARAAIAPCDVVVVRGDGDGVGASIDRGHQHLLSVLQEPFLSVVMAGDGQMNPDDMEQLVQPIMEGKADHVKGNRKLHRKGYDNMPRIRKMASELLGIFTSLAAGQTIHDPQCGYTATASHVLKKWNWNRSWKGYGYPNFWLINLAKEGWRIAEQPVESIYRNEYSGIKPASFFAKVGCMMAFEHHRRNLSWIKPPLILPHSLFALLAYLLGWSAFLPMVTNDLEDVLVERSIPPILIGLFFWSMAHLFDRLATRTRQELRGNAKT